MASRLEKLLMRIELIDKITAPVTKISGAMDKLTKNTALGFANITGGVAGLWGVGLAFNGLTAGAREMNAALGDVKSLGVQGKALTDLEKRAKAFSIAYGESAVDFVRSSYDIWGALPGLEGNELGSFTEAAGLLAKGTKADAGLVSDFMGTMYNIFEKQANQMGRANWVETMAGQVAKAVDIFKTSGKGMSDAFTNLGASAITRPMEEQVAVLGKLQAVMPGASAGTSYKSFVMGLSKAQKQMGTSFMDSQGNMLGVVDILRKIQERTKGMGDVQVNALLAKSFGEPAVAMINNLLGHVNSLEKDISTIGATPGMDDLRWMVGQMVEPFNQMVEANTAMRLGFGKLINQALTPFYLAATDSMRVVSEWIDKYPHLFGLLAKLTVGVGIVVAAVSALAIAKGMAMIAMVGFTTGLAILKFALLPLSPILKAARLAWVMFNFQIALGTKILPAAAIAMKVFGNSLLLSAKSAWAFTAALMTNPITWIVVGVVALVAGLVMLVKHWDTVKAAAVGAITWMVEKWQSFRAIIEDNPILKFIFAPLLGAADFIGLLITALDKIPAWFSSFKNWLADLNVFDVLMAPAKAALEMLNLLPGVNIDTSKLQRNPVQQAVEKNGALAPQQPVHIPVVANIAQPAPVTIPAVMQIAVPANTPTFSVPLAAVPTAPAPAENLTATVEREREQLAPRPDAPVRNVPQGGLLQQINNSNTNNNRGNTIGTLNVNTTQKVDGYSLRDQLLMMS